MYTCSYDRMKDKIETFSKFGDAGHGGITRYSLSPEAIQARNEFRRRMEAIGAAIEVDDVACMYATLPGSDPDAKRIVMGSHVDSVKNGGNYDGILGVMSAMEVLETVAEKKIPHKHPLTAMIWTNEEGSLYPPAMMCSGIICYDYLPEDIRSKFRFEDMMASKSILDNKSTFGEALEKSGFKGDRKYRISPEKYMYMFETHIEQGPILEDAGNDIGVVDCVLGMFNYRLKFYGQTTHAGTFPMPKRRDAFLAASQALCYLHEEIDKLGYSIWFTPPARSYVTPACTPAFRISSIFRSTHATRIRRCLKRCWRSSEAVPKRPGPAVPARQSRHGTATPFIMIRSS